MWSTIARAYFTLVVFDFYLVRGNFDALYQRVRNCRSTKTNSSFDTVASICRAVDLACIWYPKEVLCLQRSATTAVLLKRRGVSAELVIGAQPVPFKAHAWVEVDGRVVNDKPYVPETYAVLDRC